MKPLRHPFFVRYNSGALSSWVQHWCGSVALLWGPKQKHWDPLEEVISISKWFIYGENASPTIRFMLQGWPKCFLHPGMRHSIMDVQSNHTVATSCWIYWGLPSPDHSTFFLYSHLLLLFQTHLANKRRGQMLSIQSQGRQGVLQYSILCKQSQCHVFLFQTQPGSCQTKS